MKTEFESRTDFVEALQKALTLLHELLGKRWPAFETWLEQAQMLVATRAHPREFDRHIDRLLQIVIGTGAAALVRRIAAEAGILQSKSKPRGEVDKIRADVETGTDADELARAITIHRLDDGVVVGAPIKATRATTPAFHFVLRGEQARGATMVANSEADLVFNYELPPEEALVISSGKLDKARLANVDIGLQLTAGGGITIKGERQGVAKFDGGKMIKPVTFRLAAQGPAEARSFVQVAFTVRGETVHQAELDLKIVASPAELTKTPSWSVWAGSVAPVLLSEAVHHSTPPDQRIELSLSFDGNRFCIDLQDLRDGETWHKERFVSKDIDAGKLEVLLKQVRAELVPSYVNADFWNQFDGEVATCVRLSGEKTLRRTLEVVASAGWKLRDSLGQDEKLDAALRYVESNAKDGATITIDTEDVFLPWEILYPSFRTRNMTEQEESEYPLTPTSFWGVRFALETLQRGGNMPVGQLRLLHKQAAAKVSVNLNPTIKLAKLTPEAQPVNLQRDWATRLLTKGLLDGKVHDSCKPIRGVLQNAADEAKVIYVYCHGRPADSQTGTTEALQLDDDCELSPGDLGPKIKYKNAPIIILNACQAGVISPITFSNFLKEFRRRGALGLIATTASIPILFGACFGEELVERCLERKGALADALLELRREHLLKRSNPVPLFYTVQCQI